MAVTQDRLDRNESILRDQGMHEPTCPVRALERSKPKTPPKKQPVCNCWLSEKV